MTLRRILGRRRRAATLALVSAAALSCAEPEPEGIDRELFVDVYVALRVAELRGTEEVIAPATRRQVLERFGVTEEELLEFAERRGGDPAFMQGVWEEVRAELDSLRYGRYPEP